MSGQVVGLGDPKAIQKYSGLLAVDVPRESFWGSSMMSKGEVPKAPIQRLDDLEDEHGDRISFDLRMQFRGQMTEGDDVAEDDAEDMKFASDVVYIDQMRKVADTGGRMTKQRTLHNLRSLARDGLTEIFARAFDEMITIYLSGARGINADMVWPLGWAGRANNAITAPDTQHLMYGGAATSKASMVAGDTMSKILLDKLRTKAAMMGGGSSQIPAIQPVSVKGGKKFVVVMTPPQEHALRNDTGTSGWFEITKALTTAVGRESPIYQNALGEYRDMVLQMHKTVIRFSDYGAGANVNAARGLFLGRQAGLIAFTNAGTGMPFKWVEKDKDGENKLLIFAGAMVGFKKSTFKIPTTGSTLDFGVIAFDTAYDATLL